MILLQYIEFQIGIIMAIVCIHYVSNWYYSEHLFRILGFKLALLS